MLAFLLPKRLAMPSAYILFSQRLDRYYVGSTSGKVEERLRRHLTARSGFTSKARDWEVVFQEEFSLKSDAMKRERQIKSWKSRKMIDKLIASSSSV